MRGRSILLAALAAVSAFGVVGCKEEPPPPEPKPKPAPPPPPAPEPIDIQGLLAEMDADARIVFPQSVAPVDADLGRAVVSFAGAFLEGDDDALRSMLDLTGQAVLDRLLVTGGWYDATDELEAMHITELSEFGGGQGGSVTYAIQTPGSAYTLAWNVEPGPGGALAFSGEFTNAEERPRASDFSDGDFEVSSFDDSNGAGDAGLGYEGSALLVYTSINASAMLTNEVMGMQLDADTMFQQSMAAIPEGQRLEAEKMFNEGKIAAANGEKLSATEVSGLFLFIEDQLKTQVQQVAAMTGQDIDITRDQIVSALAKAMNSTVSEVEQLIKEGG